MNSVATVKTEAATAFLVKPDPSSPAFKVIGKMEVAIKAGIQFAGFTFAEDTIVPLPEGGLIVGNDYAVHIAGETPLMVQANGIPSGVTLLGGFHFAPGGNAMARKGGDEVPAINPYSLWDLNFRPACPDPRGMARVDTLRSPFWADIYLLGTDHMNGTSRLGQIIADGNDTPVKPDDEDPFARLDYATAVAVMRHHGKGLLSFEEFAAATYGVTERTAIGKDPKKTKLDAERTSKFGLMQATGNMWVWGHDGDPDEPRASIFGGSWLDAGHAGSRFAGVDNWAGLSYEDLGARGRSDHLQLD
jgi:hypothetical protein